MVGTIFTIFSGIFTFLFYLGTEGIWKNGDPVVAGLNLGMAVILGLFAIKEFIKKK